MKKDLLHKLLATLAILTSLSVGAAEAPDIISGVVVDSLSGKPVEYGAYYNLTRGTGNQTDAAGKFKFNSAQAGDSLKFTAMGYTPKTVAAGKAPMRIELVPTGVTLREVVVKPKKEKYSKKNNPAVDLMERLRHDAAATDPRRHDDFNFDKYQRITMAVNDFDAEGNYSWIGKKFKFLNEYADTSEITGLPVLPFIIKEKVSTVRHTGKDGEEEIVTGTRSEGLDNFMIDSEGSRRVLEDLFRDIDLYDNDITLLQSRFVSPLSRIAADFYKFYLNDTVVIDGDSCVTLSFVPHTPETWGFIGKLYVPVNDSLATIKRVEMYLPHTINVNFVDALTLRQEYELAPDGSRLKTLDDLSVVMSLVPGTPSVYSRRTDHYNNFSFLPLERPDTAGIAADARDEEFWADHRAAPLRKGESSVGDMVSRLRSVPLYYWTEKTLRVLVGGYVRTGNPSKFDYGPVNTSVSYNTAEGVRLRTGGMTTAALSKRWFARGFVAYGLRDEKVKYRAELEYSFIDKKYHSREFPVKSLRLTSLYELDQLGQKYQFTNQDNLFLSWKRMEDTRVTYRRATTLDYILELRNGFSLTATVGYERQEATRWLPFVDGYGHSFGHFNEAFTELKLRFAPGEKFVQGRNNRMPINLDAPVIELTHTYAPKGTFGNMFEINRTELRVMKRIWLSAFGYIDAVGKAGHSWSRSPYMNLFLPNANITYTIQPESFALMNPMEFINDSYASIDLTYWMNGLIFNRLPLIKKLKLREVVGFRSLWGHLSDRNNPVYNKDLFAVPEEVHFTPMSSTPYMEISAGIDNLFRVFRVESVWRLSYRHSPGAPDWGIRFAFHLSF